MEAKYGIKAKAYSVSVTDPEECRKAIYAAKADFGTREKKIGGIELRWEEENKSRLE